MNSDWLNDYKPLTDVLSIPRLLLFDCTYSFCPPHAREKAKVAMRWIPIKQTLSQPQPRISHFLIWTAVHKQSYTNLTNLISWLLLLFRLRVVSTSTGWHALIELTIARVQSIGWSVAEAGESYFFFRSKKCLQTAREIATLDVIEKLSDEYCGQWSNRAWNDHVRLWRIPVIFYLVDSRFQRCLYQQKRNGQSFTNTIHEQQISN